MLTYCARTVGRWYAVHRDGCALEVSTVETGEARPIILNAMNRTKIVKPTSTEAVVSNLKSLAHLHPTKLLQRIHACPSASIRTAASSFLCSSSIGTASSSFLFSPC